MTFDPTTVRGTPFGAPLVPPLPVRMRRVEILTIVYETDREAADALIPEPLQLGAPRAALHVYWMHDAEWFGVYGESAVQIPVRHEASGTTGAYSPLLVVEGDGPVAAGREIYGQPKKAGRITLEAHGDLLVGTVTRNDITIITATMPYKQLAGTPEDLEKHASFRTNINLKVIPNVDGSGWAVRELTARTLDEVVVDEVWRGHGTLELRPNAQVPVHLLPVREVIEAFYWRADFSLVDGEVIERFS